MQTMLTKLGVYAVITLLAGCASLAPDVPGSGGDACGARSFASMVGSPVAAATFPAGVRTIGPDTIITEDFVPGRLNVLIDSRGLITGFRCD